MKKGEQYVMLFLFPQSLFYQSLLPLLPVFPALTGMASITSESSITGQKHQAASSLQMTLVYTQEYMHTDTYTHPCLLCMFSCGILPPHATLLSFDTNTAPPHHHHHHHLRHTYGVLCVSSKQWVETTNSRSLQGREEAATVVLVCCCYSVWGVSDLPACFQ